MRALLTLTAVWCMFAFSCSVNPELIGSWETTYFDEDAASDLNFFFNDFDLFDPLVYAPVVLVSEDSIDYPLGVGMKKAHGLGGVAKSYSFDGSTLEIFDGQEKEAFHVDFESRESFCLFKGGRKVVCFEKVRNLSNCSEYAISLQVANEYYKHNIFVNDEGEAVVSREGVKSDTINTTLSPYEKQYLDYLISLIDFNGKDKDINQKTGGDYSEYKLKIECENEVALDETLRGLMDISFGLRALLVNLESYSKKEF